ncbi:MAG TPA: nucleotidyltransferase family protein [Desulfobacteraceae bacterium]|nr:nucleotidyltransferase family protein [Desulfobacteraceae bacterium]
MQAMLLAAGLGTRLRPYSDIRPKPLFPVLNRPLLLLLIDMLRGAGCGTIVVNGHHLRSQVEQAISGLPDVQYQDEPEILGTGGSLRQALPRFSPGPLLVMNADICHDVDIAALYRHHRRAGNAVTMALHDYPRFNTVAVQGPVVASFSPGHSETGGGRLAFTGIQVVEPEIIRRIPPGRFFHIIDLYRELIREGGRIGYLGVDGSFWRDIGTPADYLQVHADLLTGSRPYFLPLASPASPWLVDPEAAMGENVRLEGWGCVGRAQIGAGAVLRNCVVWDGAVIPPGSRLCDGIVPGSGK